MWQTGDSAEGGEVLDESRLLGAQLQPRHVQLEPVRHLKDRRCQRGLSSSNY